MFQIQNNMTYVCNVRVPTPTYNRWVGRQIRLFRGITLFLLPHKIRTYAGAQTLFPLASHPPRSSPFTGSLDTLFCALE